MRPPTTILVSTSLILLATSLHAAPKVKVPPPKTGTVAVPADHFAKGAKKRTRPLHYLRFRRPDSAGMPAIMLHGGPGQAVPIRRILQSPFGAVVLRHFDLVYFDQRGAGRSQIAADKRRGAVIRARRHYRPAQYVEDVELLRRRFFGDRKVMIIGSSWGGFLGAAYALDYPERVKGLILGSFAATGHYAVQSCDTVDDALLRAEARFPRLRAALAALRRSVDAKKIEWRRGTDQARVLRQRDVIELLLPFATKARYAQLTQVLQLIVKRDKKGLELLDKIDLDKGEMATAGGSLPGESTFCQAFFTRAALGALRRHPPPGRYCDARRFAATFLELCRPHFPGARPMDIEKTLQRIKVPALVFAGQWDPLLRWQSTLRAAERMPSATFVLIDGGHTPVNAGGKCFAAAVDAFARGRRIDTRCFVAAWP
jgi:pimeloyl-ACP methyl ester carboxylesterase